MDPNSILEEGFEPNPKLWPTSLPDGVKADGATFYAHRRRFANGREVWEFYKRGSTGKPGAETPDTVFATKTEVIAPIKEKFEKDKKEAEEKESKAPETRNINGVPHQITGKDANGQSVWSPVQTAAGPATAASAGTKEWRTEGTPDGQGGFDNSRPMMAAYVNGQRTGETRQPTGDELRDWRIAQQGGRTDAEIAAQQNANGPTSKVEQGGDGKFYTVTVRPGAAGAPPTITVTDAQGQPAPGNVVPGKPEATKQPTTVKATEPLKGASGWEVGKREITDANGNKTIETYYINPQGQETKIPPPDADGKKYVQVAQDKETGRWHGLTPDGKWEEMQGGPGSKPAGATGPGSSGPALPTMVLGQSQAALRQYRDQLQAEVASGRQTQAWADNRWNEAKEVATFSIQEAQLMQQERQSNTNASINLATTKLNHETGGIKTALEFALAINGKLPPGSPLGGQAFAALLGLNMIAAQRSGIYDIKVPTADPRSLEGRQIEAAAGSARSTTNNEITRLTNPGDPKALEAQRADVQAQLEREVAPTPEAPKPAPIFAPQPVAPAPMGAPIPAPAVPGSAVPAPPQTTVTAQPGAGAAPLPLPPTGTLPTPIPPPPPAVGPPSPPVPFNPPPGEPGSVPGQPFGQMQQPPPEEFAVLNQYQPQPVPQITAPQMSPMAMPPQQEPLALMRARASATPPWRLSEDQFNQFVAAGVPEEEIWRVPGMPGVMA